jgi:hypothetical protein
VDGARRRPAHQPALGAARPETTGGIVNAAAPSRRVLVAGILGVVLLLGLVLSLPACSRGEDTTSAAEGTTTSFGSGLVGGLVGPGIVGPARTGSTSDPSLPDNVATASTPTTASSPMTTMAPISPNERMFCQVYLRVGPAAEAARTAGDPAQVERVRSQFAGDEAAFRQQAPAVIATDVGIVADVYFTPRHPDDAAVSAAAVNVGGWAFEHCVGVS